MRRGSTPTIQVTVPGTDLTGYDLYLTIKTANGLIDKTGDDLTAKYANEMTIISTTLTQDETLGMTTGEVPSVQLKAKTGDTVIVTTTDELSRVEEVYNESVI